MTRHLNLRLTNVRWSECLPVSDRGKAKRVLGICVKWRTRKDHVEEHKRTLVTVEDVQQVERIIIRDAQKNEFKDETVLLQSSTASQTTPDRKEARARNVAMKTINCIYKLDLFLDQEGVLRVGDCIWRANLPDHVKHPCILPRSNHMTDLIIDHYHRKCEHQGQWVTFNTIRSRRWLLGDRGEKNCRQSTDLPEDRLEPSPPFTPFTFHSEVHFFGPRHIKEGRRVLSQALRRAICTHVFASQPSRDSKLLSPLRRM